MVTTNIDHELSSGVRTFRGRTIDELIPQIRGELGPDAIILREREGVVGGFGGFFTQRFVEVDARRGDGSSIDIYDDMPFADLRLQPQPLLGDVVDRSGEAGGAQPDEDREPVSAQDETVAAVPPREEIPATLPRKEIPATLPHKEIPATLPREEVPATRWREETPAVPRHEMAPVVAAQETQPDPEPETAPVKRRAFDTSMFLARLREASTPAADAQPASAAEETAPPPVPSPRQRPPRRRVRPLPDSVRMPAPRPNARRAHKPPPAVQQVPSRLTRVERPEAQQLAAELQSRGISEQLACDVSATAQVHGSVFSGDVRTAAATEVARKIIPPPALPLNGAAVAFVGAGGSGKSSCTAALASAYRRNGVLPVAVVTIDCPDHGQALRRRLSEDKVTVLSLSAARAAQAIESLRGRSIVVIDTPAVNPADSVAVDALRETLRRLKPDATYVTLPATLSRQAARHTLSNFESLTPSAVALTHADETDQIAAVVETAISGRIPLAYLHSGADHKSALSSIDPAQLAMTLIS